MGCTEAQLAYDAFRELEALPETISTLSRIGDEHTQVRRARTLCEAIRFDDRTAEQNRKITDAQLDLKSCDPL